jgi:16S rRNA (cytosine1402-N4)-methyltransferase
MPGWKRPRRSTPAGQHLPVLLHEVLAAIAPQPGGVVVDCTVGFGGHARALLAQLGAEGILVGLDRDAGTLPLANAHLEGVGFPFRLQYGNFAGLQGVLAAEGIELVDGVVADLGMSSMQVDDSERGFSYVRDGPLDMRMDRSRGRPASELLAALSETELAKALRELGDEPEAERIARAIVETRGEHPIQRTGELAELIRRTVQGDTPWQLHPTKGKWNLHPAALTFQALRILVNRELANLTELLRVLPIILRPGGRAAIITFHSGEDRLVKSAFRTGQVGGVYDEISTEPIRAGFAERTANPRARSAKLRWARRAGGRIINVLRTGGETPQDDGDCDHHAPEM